MKLGFIGLGHMGAAMAANLVRAGHDVTVFNRTPGRSGPLVGLGAREAANLAEACDAEAVITMLANDDAVADMVLGRDGLIVDMPKSAIHVSMSTISVALCKRLAQCHADVGQRYIAAPVFGRPDMAEAARLFIIAAGDPAAIDACKPLFDALGQKTATIGVEPSAASLVKLTANFLQASVIESLGEAIALVSKAGIDPRAYVELLTSTIFTSPAYRIFAPLIAAGTFEEAAFAVPLGYKDIRLTLAAAESLRVPMPLGSLLHDRFLRLLAQGGEHLDWSALGGLASQDAGYEQGKNSSHFALAPCLV